jgi:TolB-like protein/Tfp pilus assembly protein PilF
MFTDIEGYTAMMQFDEKQAMVIRNKHRKIINEVTEKHEGKLIQYYGDGTLSTFKSSVSAVRCAIEMQLAFMETPNVPVRIGIHVGDVISTDSDVIGDAVNIASRIESLAVSGSVLVSDKINDALRNQNDIDTSFLDSFDFKNVNKVIPVFAVVSEGIIVPELIDIEGKVKPKESEVFKSFRRKSFYMLALLILVILSLSYYMSTGSNRAFSGNKITLAVIPFDGMNNDEASSMFADGVTEDIITQLSKIQHLQITSSASAMQYKGSDKTSAEIASELNVDLILEGSVRLHSNQVRVNTQLVDGKSNKNLWANSYDNVLDEIFQIQTDVSKDIARTLEITLTTNEQDRLENLPTKNADAYMAYKQGQMFLNRGGGKVEELKQAEDFFKESIKLDPEFCRAYVGLADSYVEYIYWGRGASKEVLEKASSPALTALAINSDDGGSYGALGAISFYKFERDTAERYLEKALEINPSYVGAYDKLAWIRVFDSDLEGAVALFEKALELDPLSIKYLANIAYVYAYFERYDDGLKILNERVANFSQDDNMLLWMKANILAQKGDYKNAIPLFNSRSVASNTNWMLGYAYAKSGETEKANDILNYQLNKSESHFVPPYMIATIYMGLGDEEKALDWLEKDYDIGGSGFFFWLLKKDAKFKSLYDNPRFLDLLNKIE